MRCPFCAFDSSQVKDSRPTEDGSAIRRRRQCEDCGARFTTFERIQLRELTILKSDDRREPFERAKLERSIATACRKRPVPPERIERLVGIYEKYSALPQLGQGVSASIPALFLPTMTEFAVERWNAAWQAAGKGKPDLEVPLRLLDAAERWRKQPDRRVLLSLPAEERRILESLLPAEKPPA